MTMKLVILGLLMEGNRHPYEMSQEIKKREMHHYIKMQPGSLYYAIERMQQDGFICTVQVEKEGNRPDRTIYQISDKGRAEFQQMLLQFIEENPKVFRPMNAALAFMRHGNPEQIARALEKKIALCEQESRAMKELYDKHVPIVSRSVLHMMWGAYEHSLVQLRWLRRLHRDAAAGKLGTRGEPLDLESE